MQLFLGVNLPQNAVRTAGEGREAWPEDLKAALSCAN